jgi:hypothetical protein
MFVNKKAKMKRTAAPAWLVKLQQKGVGHGPKGM